jgi:hypothetical protein
LKPVGLPESQTDSGEARAPVGLAEQIGAAGKRNGARQ